MFRLFRLTFALIVVLSTAIYLAHLIGSRHPSPLALLFTNPDGTHCERPCLFGIGPNKMSIDEAVATLKKHWLLRDVHMLESPSYAFPLAANSKGLFPGTQLLIYLEPGPGNQNPIMATAIELVLMEPGQSAISHLDQPIVSLGEVVAVVGEPELLVPWEHNIDWYAIFPRQGIRIHLEPFLGPFRAIENEIYETHPDDMIFSLEISDPNWLKGYSGNKWCGFSRRNCGTIDSKAVQNTP